MMDVGRNIASGKRGFFMDSLTKVDSIAKIPQKNQPVDGVCCCNTDVLFMLIDSKVSKIVIYDQLPGCVIASAHPVVSFWWINASNVSHETIVTYGDVVPVSSCRVYVFSRHGVFRKCSRHLPSVELQLALFLH